MSSKSPTFDEKYNTPLGSLSPVNIDWLTDNKYLLVEDSKYTIESNGLVINAEKWSGGEEKLANKIHNAINSYKAMGIAYDSEKLINLIRLGQVGSVKYTSKPSPNSTKTNAKYM